MVCVSESCLGAAFGFGLAAGAAPFVCDKAFGIWYQSLTSKATELRQSAHLYFQKPET